MRAAPMPLHAHFSKVEDRSGKDTVASLTAWRNAGFRLRNGSERQEKDMPDGILGWLLIGLVAGALGKLIMPGRDPGGIIVTILIGIAGALLAFYLAPLLGVDVTRNNWRAYGAATAGSVILLALYRMVVARRI
jgi:uncharacterized membrane protein YeaQ/YmgE (transglycosylase-associated protein family)